MRLNRNDASVVCACALYSATVIKEQDNLPFVAMPVHQSNQSKECQVRTSIDLVQDLIGCLLHVLRLQFLPRLTASGHFGVLLRDVHITLITSTGETTARSSLYLSVHLL